MALDKTQLTKVANLHSVAGAAGSRQMFGYFTTDTLAVVTAAGYFNDVRGFFMPGDIIRVFAANGVADVELVAVPKTGNVTTKNLSGVGGRRTASGIHVTVTAVDTLVTGLAKVDAIYVVLASDPILACLSASASIGDQNGAPASGSVYIKTWKPTAANDATPVAATTFGRSVNWLAVGS